MSKLDDYKAIVAKWLYIENTEHIDICFGVMFANLLLDSNPVWLFLVGPPSSGKTAAIQPASAHSLLYALSKLTPNTLISHHVGKNGRDSSLIPKLHNKVLIIKDFTAMLSMRTPDLHAILGQLRDAYDGECASAAGIGNVKRFNSKFGIIAAVTGSIDKQRPLMTELGERFITYRMPIISTAEAKKRSFMNKDSVREMNEELREAAIELLNQRVAVPRMHIVFKRKIYRVAEFVAKARCHIERDRFTKEPELPQPEVPTRLAGQLNDLARGIAMARGKAAVDGADARLVQKVGLHSLTYKRIALLRTMLSSYPGHLTIAEVAERMGFPEPTIRVHIQNLELLKLLEKKQVLGVKGHIVNKYRVLQEDLLTELLA